MIVSTANAAAADFSTVISTADLKTHLRVTHSDEDGLIEAYRTSACQFIEAYCNTRLTSQSVYYYADGFSAIIELPIGPIISVDAVQYQADKDGAKLTLDSSTYYVEKARNPAIIKLITSPSVDADDPTPVRITATTGYTSTPEALVQAVRFLVAHYYEHRQAAEAATIKEVPLGLYSILNPYRTISFI
jgi:uncharacterized phiE125 gp8 family phage protein